MSDGVEPFSIGRLWPTVKRLFAAMLRQPLPSRTQTVDRKKIVGAVAVVLAAVAVFFVFFDAQIVRAAHAFTQSNRFADFFFLHFTNIGKTFGIMLLGVPFAVALACNYWPVDGVKSIRKRFGVYADANFILFSVGFAGGGASLVKNLIGRARPRLLEEVGAFHFEPARFEPSFASFPSGHSATFAALAVSFALVVPKYRVAFLVFGAVGGLSRIMLSAHYPSDVLAGLAFGAAVTLLIAHHLRRRGLLFSSRGGIWPIRHR